MDLLITLLAFLRFLLPDVLLPATTALGSIDPLGVVKRESRPMRKLMSPNTFVFHIKPPSFSEKHRRQTDQTAYCDSAQVR